MIKDNKLFREEAEKRFSSYQKEIENLRTSSLVNSNNNLFTNNIITPNINYKYDDNLEKQNLMTLIEYIKSSFDIAISINSEKKFLELYNNYVKMK